MSEWIQTMCTFGELSEVEGGARWAAVSMDLAHSLETTHRASYECVARDTKLGAEALTRDVPNVAQVEHLDAATGVVQVGTRVKPGMVLIGKTTPLGGGPLNPEEKLLRAVFGEKAGEARDASLYAPPGVRGEVVDAERRPAEGKGEISRATVTVEWIRPLSVGDELEIEGHGRAVVCAIRPGASGLEVDGIHGEVRVRKATLAEDVIAARAIGPYSLITQQPLGGRGQRGGQRITEAQLRSLLGAGGVWAAGECLTIKSDAVSGRVQAHESMVRGQSPEPYPEPTESGPLGKSGQAAAGGSGTTDIFSFFECAPATSWVQIESAKVLRVEAQALGFEIDWAQEEAEARWLGPETIRERSHGEVKKPETINYRTFKPEPGGLFCAKIFGPLRDYECLCGKYERMKHRGIICEKCGVEVIQSKVRRERFGHIVLAEPLLHPWLAEPIGHLLSMSEAEVRESTGADLHRALSDLDLGALEQESSPRGMLSRALRAAGHAPADLMVPVALVPPPDLRPLVPLDGGRFATSDLNDLYRRLINRNNRTRRLIELSAPETIIANEKRMLQEAYDAVIHNADLPKPLTGPNKRPLKCLTSMLSARGETNLVSKRVDYSGVAQLVVDPELAERECRLPRTMALELFKPRVFSALEQSALVTTIKGARRLVEKAIDAIYEAEEPCDLEPPPPPNTDMPSPHLERRIDELQLSARTANALQNAGIETIGELVWRTDSEMLRTRCLERRSLKEVKKVLSGLGLHLGMVDGVPSPAWPQDCTPMVLAQLAQICRGAPVLLVSGDKVLSREVTLWGEPAIAVHPSTACLLPELAVTVHVPLTDRARAECAAMDDHAAPVEREESGWLTELLLGTGQARDLARAALEGEVDPLEDPLVRLALGLRPE